MLVSLTPPPGPHTAGRTLKVGVRTRLWSRCLSDGCEDSTPTPRLDDLHVALSPSACIHLAPHRLPLKPAGVGAHTVRRVTELRADVKRYNSRLRTAVEEEPPMLGVLGKGDLAPAVFSRRFRTGGSLFLLCAQRRLRKSG